MEKLNPVLIAFIADKKPDEMVPVMITLSCKCEPLLLAELTMAGFRCAFSEWNTLTGKIAAKDVREVKKIPPVAAIRLALESYALN